MYTLSEAFVSNTHEKVYASKDQDRKQKCLNDVISKGKLLGGKK